MVSNFSGNPEYESDGEYSDLVCSACKIIFKEDPEDIFLCAVGSGIVSPDLSGISICRSVCAWTF